MNRADERYQHIRYERLRPQELQRLQDECPLVFVPVGPIEYHGPHMPLVTDPLNAFHTALGVCAQIGRGVVYPPVYWGTDSYLSTEVKAHFRLPTDRAVLGMDYPEAQWKSHYSSPWLFAAVMEDLVRQLVRNKYTWVVIVNGHGAPAQHQMLDAVCSDASENMGVTVEWYMTQLDLSPDEPGGHADIAETSLNLYYEREFFPNPLVDLTMLPDEAHPLRYCESSVVDARGWELKGDGTVAPGAHPARATADRGRAIFEKAVTEIVRSLTLRIDRRYPTAGDSIS